MPTLFIFVISQNLRKRVEANEIRFKFIFGLFLNIFHEVQKQKS